MNKTRLTITINPAILSSIDRLIDGKTIRNRSHAIEYLLNQQLLGKVTQAVILVGGKKEAITHALTPVAGQSVLKHLIHLLVSHGIHQILLITDQDVAKLSPEVAPFPQVTIVEQPSHMGTAGALLHARKILSNQPFIVMHGDIFTNINLTDLITFHNAQSTQITIAVKPKFNQREFGKAMVHGQFITEFTFKPKESSEVAMINTGVYIVNPTALDYIKNTAKRPLMLESDLFPQLAHHRQLSGFIFEGIWYDISNKK